MDVIRPSNSILPDKGEKRELLSNAFVTSPLNGLIQRLYILLFLNTWKRRRRKRIRETKPAAPTWQDNWQRRTPGPPVPTEAADRYTWCWRSAARHSPTPPCPGRGARRWCGSPRGPRWSGSRWSSPQTSWPYTRSQTGYSGGSTCRWPGPGEGGKRGVHL